MMNEKLDRDDELRVVHGLFGVCFVRGERAARRATLFNVFMALALIALMAVATAIWLAAIFQILKVEP
ncbi:hypothetical protein [Rhizobium sp. PAMB 3182]